MSIAFSLVPEAIEAGDADLAPAMAEDDSSAAAEYSEKVPRVIWLQ
jgi:hypothetical protein